MIDTHSHLLPELDDGCPSLEASVRMARAAFAEGIEGVICTPHVDQHGYPTMDRVLSVRDQLQQALADEGIDLSLYVGAELPFSFLVDADDDVVAGYVLEGTRALLVEMPSSGWPPYLEPTLHELRLQGYLPVLAHPERTRPLQRNPDRLRDLLRLGCVAQVTAASIEGTFGRGPRSCAFELMSAGLVSLLATDAHYTRPESWTLTGTMGHIGRRSPDLEVEAFVRRNPRRLLDAQVLEQPAKVELRSAWKRHISSGLRGLLRSRDAGHPRSGSRTW